MAVLRIIAGPDDGDPMSRATELGDPQSVSLEGLRVATVEDASRFPISRELRDARERASGALAALGARPRGFPCPRGAAPPCRSWPRCNPPGRQRPPPSCRRRERHGPPCGAWSAGDPHTASTRITLAPSGSRQALRDGPRMLGAGEALAAELVDAIGDGVLLHPAHPRPAPRHGHTGRPWLLTPAAVFNLAGVPVTEVPLGPLRGPAGRGPGRGRRGRDHVSIAVALELERAFGGWVPPPARGPSRWKEHWAGGTRRRAPDGTRHSGAGGSSPTLAARPAPSLAKTPKSGHLLDRPVKHDGDPLPGPRRRSHARAHGRVGRVLREIDSDASNAPATKVAQALENPLAILVSPSGA